MLHNLLKFPHPVNTGSRTEIQVGSSRLTCLAINLGDSYKMACEGTIAWEVTTEKC